MERIEVYIQIFTFLVYSTEELIINHWNVNVVDILIISESCDVSDVKMNHGSLKLIGRPAHHKVIDADPQLAEKLRVNVLLFFILALI